MKTLTLLRHAKSSWDDPVARDFDRPLNARGREAAQAIGREMRALGLAFDRDPRLARGAGRRDARRARRRLWQRARPGYDQRIYLASPATLLDLSARPPTTRDRLLHRRPQSGAGGARVAARPRRPDGLRDEIAVKYPTATLAEIALAESNAGATSRRARATLDPLHPPARPRSELGPDAGCRAEARRQRSGGQRAQAARRGSGSCWLAGVGAVAAARPRLAVAAAAWRAAAGRRGSYSRPG